MLCKHCGKFNASPHLCEYLLQSIQEWFLHGEDRHVLFVHGGEAMDQERRIQEQQLESCVRKVYDNYKVEPSMIHVFIVQPEQWHFDKQRKCFHVKLVRSAG